MMFGKHGALCSLLIRLANTYGTLQEDHIWISKTHTNTEFADMIGSTRESVNRILSELRRANAIAIDNSHIVIKDLSYLRDICHCEDCPKDICRM
ncbi:helix-turn-helix domain-containing protein [Paenibacillus sp. NEAU-GSW1]|nr:helix-turn-helix domain-containing protein [Paenibacillus sp. NEAU-GSW1]